MVQIVIFLLITLAAGYWAYTKYKLIYDRIQLGKPTDMQGDTETRWSNVMFKAFGQEKMFKRPLVGILHFFIYTAFLLTQIELIEIMLDGVTGHHRMLAKPLGMFYTFLINMIEIASLMALVATVVFLIRRNVLHIKRFENPEMNGWPKFDANLILLGELVLIFSIFSMNAAYQQLHVMHPLDYPPVGYTLLSMPLSQIFMSDFSLHTLQLIERTGWWLHYLVVLGFIMYLPISKHLHIFMAFFNIYYARLTPRGAMDNMPIIEQEIKSMMGLSEGAEEMTEEIPEFGVRDVFDLQRNSLIGAYSCTECGRCTDECPANKTGKKLSPRKIMMNVRDRLEAIDPTRPQETYADSSLFDLISHEELFACTSCNACVEACPVLINPLDIILDMRRYVILTESQGPADWVPMFNALENSGSPWQIPEARDAWTKQLND